MKNTADLRDEEKSAGAEEDSGKPGPSGSDQGWGAGSGQQAQPG